MNEVDFLDQLNVPVIGMPKDFVPGFLAKYKDAPGTEDLGAICRPIWEMCARPQEGTSVRASFPNKPKLNLMTDLTTSAVPRTPGFPPARE